MSMLTKTKTTEEPKLTEKQYRLRVELARWRAFEVLQRVPLDQLDEAWAHHAARFANAAGVDADDVRAL